MAQCLTQVLSTAVKKSLGVVTAKGKQGGVDKLSVQNTDTLTGGPNTFTKLFILRMNSTQEDRQVNRFSQGILNKCAVPLKIERSMA